MVALPADCDVVVVGAGFAGLYMLHKLRRLGFHAHVIEAGGGVGGTWYWNRYPGARCDIPSIEYSYEFDEDLQQEWVWTEQYASQPEILRYAEHVAERFELWSGITFDTRVTGADFDETDATWTVRTDDGATVRARYLIGAVGCLSATEIPDWPGQQSFRGETYHTGAWPHEGVDLHGKRVAVIGTGSSGIQVIPMIAEEAASLTVFQRTPSYSIPARNRPLPPEELDQLKANYPEIRRTARAWNNGRICATEGRPLLGEPPAVVDEVLHKYWEMGGLSLSQAYTDITVDLRANQVVSDFIRARIADAVADPAKSEILSPRSYPFATRRPCLDTNFYQTFNRENVDLVDVRTHPIVELTPTGLRTEDAAYEFDVIVFATGYDAMTGSLLRLGVAGRGGRELREAWSAGPVTYLGLGVHGFPNFFVIAGPGSPSVFSNVLQSIEQHVEWLGDLLAHAREVGADWIEARAEAQEAWVRHSIEVFEASIMNGVDSWYVGANIPGKPRMPMPYIGGTTTYRATCEEIARNGYEGLRIDRCAAALATNP